VLRFLCTLNLICTVGWRWSL